MGELEEVPVSVCFRKLVSGEHKKFGDVVYNVRKGLEENNRDYVYGLLVMCQTLRTVLSVSLICAAALSGVRTGTVLCGCRK